MRVGRMGGFGGLLCLSLAWLALGSPPVRADEPPACGPLAPEPPCCAPVVPVPTPEVKEPKAGHAVLGILPEHCKCVTREAPCRMCKVCRPQFETCKVPRYELKLVDTFLTIKKPILKPGLGPLLVPMTVPDVREYDVPIYETMQVPRDCRCPEKTEPRRVVARTEKRKQTCGSMIIFVEVPGKQVPHVVVRYETQKIPTGKQFQWVRKDDVETQRFIGNAMVEEPVPGPRPPPTIETICVPCEAVTVIANPGPNENLEKARTAAEPLRLPGTRRILTFTEYQDRLRAIQTSPIAADALPAPAPAKPVRR